MSQESVAPPQKMTAQPDENTQLRMLSQYIKDLSFENPNAPQALTSDEAPDLEIEVDVVTYKHGGDQHEVVVNVSGLAKAGNVTHYHVELSYAGLFELSGFTKQQENLILLVNCTGLMFPFIRNLIGEMTRQGGFAPIWLDPIDWGTLYEERMRELAASDGTHPQNGAQQATTGYETVN